MPLLVLYDSLCPFCVRCRQWLESSTQVVPLHFLCCRSSTARRRYGEIDGLGEELVVVDTEGRYWVGPEAFLTCFWALDAGNLASGALYLPFAWPIARAVFRSITARRGSLGAWLGAPCHGEHCGAAVAGPSPYR